MRSRTPKMLHDLCGISMGLWPIRAALTAGAGRVIVVDSPERTLASVLPDGVELAVQPSSDGTGGAVRAAIAHLDAGAGAAAGGGAGAGLDAGAEGDSGVGVGGDAGAGSRGARGDRDVGAGNEDGAIVVLSGDVPLISANTIAELVTAHHASGAQATMASAILEDPTGYGRIVRDANGAVERVVETKAEGDATPEQLLIREVNAGVYVFSPPALRTALPHLSANNAQGELYLPQALDLIRADGGTVAAHPIADRRLVLGVNDLVALAHVRALAQEAIHARHMEAGVTIVDPRATIIDVDVQIGPDTTIEPFTTLRGATRIGAGCLLRCSYVIDSVLEDNVTIGPFAYLRPGSRLRAGAKVGTFVEIKSSDIGAGAKIPHLSYIGDADVGAGSNLGAGTITANYDGHAKHRTTIGSGVRGGVDTAFVAPVTVGDGAYTAAGSVITEDVPPGALAVARARQRNVEAYTERQQSRLDSKT